MAQANLTVDGMACDGCASSVESSLKALPGVSEASVDLGKAQAQVTFDEAQTSVEKLLAAVREAGYEPSVRT